MPIIYGISFVKAIHDANEKFHASQRVFVNVRTNGDEMSTRRSQYALKRNNTTDSRQYLINTFQIKVPTQIDYDFADKATEALYWLYVSQCRPSPAGRTERL